MTVHRVIIPAALILALAGTANAAQRGGDRRGGHDTGRTASARAPQRSEPRAAEPRSSAPRANESRPRTEGSRSYESRSRGYEGRSRVYEARPRTYEVRPRVYVSPRIVRPYRSYRSYTYARPYYSFHPRLSLGFGIWVGDPVPYPVYGYDYPYPYSYSYPDSAYPPAPYPDPQYGSSYPAQPNVVAPSAVGGISFEMTPDDAEVYVDGQDVGQVGDFSPSSSPLSLEPGRHHIELQAPGYIPMTFDADVVAGQVVPYRGDLRRE